MSAIVDLMFNTKIPIVRFNKLYSSSKNKAIEEKLSTSEAKLEYLNKINNYKLLIEIKDTLINLVPYSNEVKENIEVKKKLKKYHEEIKEGKTTEALNILKELYKKDIEKIKIGLVYSIIPLLVDEVIKIIRNYKTPEATLCEGIIHRMKDNICVFNFIRHLVNLGFLASLTIETSLKINLSLTSDKTVYETLHKGYPYYLASLISTDFIEKIIESSFNRNLNDTNMYTNCKGNKESDTTVPKTPNPRKNKYLKYKFKYLKLKNQMGGVKS